METTFTAEELNWALKWIGAGHLNQEFFIFEMECTDELGETLNYVSSIIQCSPDETLYESKELLKAITNETTL